MKMRASEMFGQAVGDRVKLGVAGQQLVLPLAACDEAEDSGGGRAQEPKTEAAGMAPLHQSATNATHTPDQSRSPTPLRATPSPLLLGGVESTGIQQEYSSDWTEPLVAEPLIRFPSLNHKR